MNDGITKYLGTRTMTRRRRHTPLARNSITGIAALCLYAAMGSLAAQESPISDGWEFRLDTDNDTLLGTDRDFSNGLRVAALKTDGNRWIGWAFGNETFTPSDIKLLPDEIPPTDRPYAGWSYFSYFHGRVDAADSAVIWEYTLGCIGPCSRAERFQKFWHSHVVDAPEPQGWSAQIQDEYGLQVRRKRQIVLDRKIAPDRTLVADLERTTEFQIGNVFTDAAIGYIGRVRLGNMRGYYDGSGFGDLTPMRPLRLDISDADGAPARAEYHDRPGGGWLWSDESFLFAHIQGKVVARNSTIEGELFSDKSPFTQDIRHGVIRTEFGIKFVWRRLALTASWNSVSTEVLSQPWELNQHSWLTFYAIVR